MLLQSAGINRLPVELLEGSLRFLPIRSLKDARLTCQHWGAVGARCLFRRVYFAPRQEVIDVFLKITGNEAFTSNIEELVYDARLFWRRFEDPQVYTDAYNYGFSDTYPENGFYDPREEEPEYGDSDSDVNVAAIAANEQDTRGSALLHGGVGMTDLA